MMNNRYNAQRAVIIIAVLCVVNIFPALKNLQFYVSDYNDVFFALNHSSSNLTPTSSNNLITDVNDTDTDNVATQEEDYNIKSEVIEDAREEIINRMEELTHENENKNEPEPEPTSELFTTNFTFPTREERVKYYMGNHWWNKTIKQLNPEDCDLIDNQQGAHQGMHNDNLYTISYLRRAVEKRKDWITQGYLGGILEIMESSYANEEEENDDNRGVVARLGDSQPPKKQILPVVDKTRLSHDNLIKFDRIGNIIWPLHHSRHYGPVQKYLDLKKVGGETPWDKKKNAVLFRGEPTGDSVKDPIIGKADISGFPSGPRKHVVKEYGFANKNDIDVALRSGVSMKQQLSYKYLLSIEGNDVATGLKWQLASDSVVFMAKPMTVSFAMEELLVPFVHYVPIKSDYSNLMEMVEWARENDKKCKWISQQASLYMDKLWISEKAQEDFLHIKRELGRRYHEQFGAISDKCDGSEWGL